MESDPDCKALVITDPQRFPGPQGPHPNQEESHHRHLRRPENNDIQLAMFYDYKNNVPLYPSFQAYFRAEQPPTLIVYGKNDHIFPEAGAHAYREDLKNIDFNLYDAGHFALDLTEGSDERFLHDILRVVEILSSTHGSGKSGVLISTHELRECAGVTRSTAFY